MRSGEFEIRNEITVLPYRGVLVQTHTHLNLAVHGFFST